MAIPQSITDYPRSAIQDTIVSPYVWYRMREGTGTALSDVGGRGPTINVGDTVTNLWTNPLFGCTYDAAGNYAFGQDTGTIFDSIFNLANSAEQGQIIIAWDYAFDGGITGSEQFFCYGANTTAGYWGLSLNTSNQVELNLRGVGASNVTLSTMTSFNLFTDAAGANSVSGARISLLADVRIGSVSATCNLYSNGVSVTAATGVDMFANSATGYPGATKTQPLSLFSRKTSTGSSGSANFDRKGGATASNGKIGLFFAMRRATRSETLPLLLNTQFYQNQGEWPLALIGA